jgi:N-acetyl-beta-hexosaminidase
MDSALKHCAEAPPSHVLLCRQLQGFLMHTASQFLRKLNKSAAAWDEALETNGQADKFRIQDLTIQTWHSASLAEAASEVGCDVIMSPTGWYAQLSIAMEMRCASHTDRSLAAQHIAISITNLST